ncbi:MAG: hypothetical protein JWM19_976 [Actinomycetia bacterium]|nr:hypothetical protein [Actinomycetes bacterium]
MTERHAAYIVILDEDVREDDSVHAMNAIRMIRGVASVEPVTADYELVIATRRAGDAWRKALVELLGNGPPEL